VVPDTSGEMVTNCCISVKCAEGCKGGHAIRQW